MIVYAPLGLTVLGIRPKDVRRCLNEEVWVGDDLKAIKDLP